MSGPLQLHDPDSIGEYVLNSRLGEGAMGVVYKGWDPTGTPVAIKVVARKFLAEQKYRQRFEQEAEVAKRIPRHCTAAVLAASSADPLPYIVTEYVPGQTLDEMLISDVLSSSQILSTALGVAAALHVIHKAGVVHRDLKPANIIMSPYGPRVIDFGLATLAESRRRLTSSGHAVGTPEFMAPEQARGEGVSEKADIFSWGATVLYAATGQHARQISSQRAIEDVELPFQLRPLAMAALSDDPAMRPTAQDIVSALMQFSPGVLASAADIAEVPRASSTRRTAESCARESAESLEANRPALALHLANQGTIIDDLHAKCWYLKGLALLQLGDQKGGEEALRLAHDIDPADETISAGYAQALASSPELNSKVLALRLPSANEASVDLYVAQLVSAGREGILKALEVVPKHPLVTEAYSVLALQEIDEIEHKAMEARAEEREHHTISQRARKLGVVHRDQAILSADLAAKAAKKADEAEARVKELTQRAYILTPHSRPIRLRYAETLLGGGSREVVEGYRLSRDDPYLVQQFALRILQNLPPSQLDQLYIEVSKSDPAQFRMFVIQFLEAVRSTRPTARQWQTNEYYFSRRAILVEQICAFCESKLSGSSEKDVALTEELQIAKSRAFAADFEEQLRQSYALSTLSLIGAGLYIWGIFTLTAPTWWLTWWIAAPWLLVTLGSFLNSTLRYSRGAMVRKRRRIAAGFQDLQEAAVYDPSPKQPTLRNYPIRDGENAPPIVIEGMPNSEERPGDSQ